MGKATIWRWKQGGLSFAHLGGSAGALSGETKVLLGRPDVLIIGVGGGAKVYNANEAAAIIKELSPKQIIPVQYARNKKLTNCDLTSIEPFLDAMKGTSVKNVGKTFSLPKKIKDKMIINVMK